MQQHKLLNLTEYLFKETVVQPSTEEYFSRVQFYTGLPGFDVLNITFCFFSPFGSQNSKILILFQEFVVVLVKIRRNVPLQDVAFRFGVFSFNSFKDSYCMVDCLYG